MTFLPETGICSDTQMVKIYGIRLTRAQQTGQQTKGWESRQTIVGHVLRIEELIDIVPTPLSSVLTCAYF